MAYHTLADIEARLGRDTLIQLTDDDHIGVIEEAVTDDAATAAANVIDGYLRGHATLPLSPVPGIVREASIALAIHSMYLRRSRSEVPEQVIAERDAAIRYLEHIADGRIILDDPGATSSARSYRSPTDDSGRVLPRAKLGLM